MAGIDESEETIVCVVMAAQKHLAAAADLND